MIKLHARADGLGLIGLTFAIAPMFGCAATELTPSQLERARAEANLGSPGAWCHGNLASTGGTEVSLDYQVVEKNQDPQQLHIAATPVWLNVKNAAFTGTESAHAVLLEDSYAVECGLSCPLGETVLQIDLAYENGRFTAETPNLSIVEMDFASAHPEVATLYQIAVVVDGTWYKAPTGDNLKLNPSSFQGYCAQGSAL